jgi:hypothetical protein
MHPDMKEKKEMDQRLDLPSSAKLLLLGNVALVVPALYGTLWVMTHSLNRWTSITRYRAPYLAMFLAVTLISIIKTWRGSHRSANWMLILFSIFVGVCIWESAMAVGKGERLGIDISEITLAGWWAIFYGLSSFVWLGLNVWYFYGRWGMVPRTR